MHNPALVLENNTHKPVWDFDIHTDHLISTRRPDLIIIKKKKKKSTWKIVDFAVPVNHRIKLKECEKKDKYLDLAKESKKNMEHAGDNYTNCNWCVWNSNYRITKGTGGLASWRMSRDNPNDSIIENGHNTEKSPRDMRTFAVTQTLVKNHRLTLIGKTLKEWIKIMIILLLIIIIIIIINTNNFFQI